MADSAFDLDNNIIAKLGLQDMPEEERLKLLDEMAELVQKRVMIRMMEALPEADVDEANRLASDPQKLLEFMASKVNVAEMLVEETERLKNELFLRASEPTADELLNPPASA